MGRGIHRMSQPQSPSKGSRYGLCSLDIRFPPSEILGEVYFFGWRDNSMVVRCSQVRGEEGWYSSYINGKTISYRASYYTLHQSSYTSIGYTSSFRERAKNVGRDLHTRKFPAGSTRRRSSIRTSSGTQEIRRGRPLWGSSKVCCAGHQPNAGPRRDGTILDL